MHSEIVTHSLKGWENLSNFCHENLVPFRAVQGLFINSTIINHDDLNNGILNKFEIFFGFCDIILEWSIRRLVVMPKAMGTGRFEDVRSVHSVIIECWTICISLHT
ncbi:hypothetical protein TNCV_3265631 [Trichonephila clavipes]|nr:hypothetical protein TNCV_3265631 [Trichonephila clavipes]